MSVSWRGKPWEKGDVPDRSGIRDRGLVNNHIRPNLEVRNVMIDKDRERELRILLSRRLIGRRKPGAEALNRYHQALIHRSYLQEEVNSVAGSDNERLEFLGDRILNLIVAEFLFQTCPGQEGDLTTRMEWTKNRNLARVILATRAGFENLILVGSNQEKTPRIIAGAFEAFVAALYFDLGFSRTKTIIRRILVSDFSRYSQEENYKKLLQEYLQKHDRPLPVYDLMSRTGAAHKPWLCYVVRVDGVVIGRGFGTTKAQATQDAARNGLEALARQINQRAYPY